MNKEEIESYHNINKVKKRVVESNYSMWVSDWAKQLKLLTQRGISLVFLRNHILQCLLLPLFGFFSIYRESKICRGIRDLIFLSVYRILSPLTCLLYSLMISSSLQNVIHTDKNPFGISWITWLPLCLVTRFSILYYYFIYTELCLWSIYIQYLR